MVKVIDEPIDRCAFEREKDDKKFERQLILVDIKEQNTAEKQKHCCTEREEEQCQGDQLMLAVAES